MPLKKINYSKEDAINLYLENYRHKILNELKIQEVQKRIKNKINNVKEKNNIDLIFYKKHLVGFNINKMSDLLSTECTNIIEKSSNKNIEKSVTSKCDTNKHVQCNLDINKKSKLNKYLDLEAECSSNESENSDEDAKSDISIIDNQEIYIEENKLFYEQKEKEDNKILKKLKLKYGKKKKLNLENITISIDDSEEKEEKFSEIDLDVEGVKFIKKDYEFVKEENNEVYKTELEFSNLHTLTKNNSE